MKRASTFSLTVEIGLRFIGLWPDLAFADLYWFTYMMILVIIQYCQYAYVVAHFKLNNLWILMDCLSLTLAYTHAFLKLLVLRWNRRLFHRIVKAMDQDWKECSSDSYVFIVNMADIARRLSNTVFIFNSFVAFFLTIGEHFFQSISNANQIGNNSETSPRQLPIKMQLPFDVSESPIFECFLIGQFVYDLVIACIVGLMNVSLVTLILHVNGQIDIIRHNLIEISSKKYDHNTFLTVIKTLIRKHQRIILLAEDIESVFTYVALLQLLWNTLIICCTGFVIVVIVNNGKDATALIKFISYYLAITIEAFVFCFAGEFLSAKSKSIGDTIYESLWYNMSPSNSRILMFMMLRCQKRLTITAGRVIDLTLESFTSVMKASVSYISVLNIMY